MEEPDESPAAMFQRTLKVSAQLAELLVSSQLTSLEEVAFYSYAELAEVTGLPNDDISTLRRVARLYLQNELLDDAFGD